MGWSCTLRHRPTGSGAASSPGCYRAPSVRIGLDCRSLLLAIRTQLFCQQVTPQHLVHVNVGQFWHVLARGTHGHAPFKCRKVGERRRHAAALGGPARLRGTRWRGRGQRAAHAAVTSSLSPDDGTLYVGWVAERPPVWKGGVDVVDLAAGRVVQTVALPDVPDQAAAQSAGVDPASVTVAPDGATAMIGRDMWYPGGLAPGSWHATAPIRSHQLGAVSVLAAGPQGLDGGSCAGSGGPAGFITSTTYDEICYLDSGAILRRVDLAGRLLGDTSLGGANGVGFGLGTVADPTRHLLYAWDPFGRRLLRIDLTTGQITGTGTVPAPSADTDPLSAAARALGDWLSPPAEAKTYLSPSLAISPDGSRLYALGTAAADPTSVSGGSTGVWVFDSASLAVLDHWAPQADYISLALNVDGTLVLAAGMPGADAAGIQNDQAASVTIYDAATGAVRAIAGQVQPNAAGWVTFPPPTP